MPGGGVCVVRVGVACVDHSREYPVLVCHPEGVRQPTPEGEQVHPTSRRAMCFSDEKIKKGTF